MCHSVVLCATCSSTEVIRGTVVCVAALGSIPDEVRHGVKKTCLLYSEAQSTERYFWCDQYGEVDHGDTKFTPNVPL